MHQLIALGLALVFVCTASAPAQSINITLDNTDTVRTVSATSDAQGDGQDFPGTPQSQTLQGIGLGGFSQTVQSNTSSDMGSIATAKATQDSEIDLNPFHIFWAGTAEANTQRVGFDFSTNAVGKSIGDFFFDVNGSAVGYTLMGTSTQPISQQGDVTSLSVSLSGPNGVITTLTPGQQQTQTGNLNPGRYELQIVAAANFLDNFPNPGAQNSIQGSADLSFMPGTMPQRLPGDANDDGKVGFADLLILAQHYGLTSGQTFDTGDFNNDGGVGFDDLLILAQHYGQMQTAAAAVSPVPEPASLGTIGAFACTLVVRRRR